MSSSVRLAVQRGKKQALTATYRLWKINSTLVAIFLPRCRRPASTKSCVATQDDTLCVAKAPLNLFLYIQTTMPKHCSTAQKERVLFLYEEGVPSKIISEKLSLSHNTVKAMLRRFRAHGSTENHKSTGRPPKLSADEKERLHDEVLQNEKVPLQQTINDSNLNITRPTAHRVLREYGVGKHRETPKPDLKLHHEERCLQFALEHRDWSIIWSEKTIA